MHTYARDLGGLRLGGGPRVALGMLLGFSVLHVSQPPVHERGDP